ncbi:MAG: hypothetical protein ABW171_18210 [Steroidobacter sp.]
MQQLWLAVGLVAAFIVAALYWRRLHAPASAARATPAHGPIVYRDAPTVRVNDSQRVDRARKAIRLKVGESFDVLANAPALPPRFRITLKNILDGSDVESAQIAVEFGGAQLSCGPLVKENGFNEYIMPRAARDEHRSSVFYYQERGESLEFMRIKLKSADLAGAQAELEIMQLQGHWATLGAGE